VSVIGASLHDDTENLCAHAWFTNGDNFITTANGLTVKVADYTSQTNPSAYLVQYKNDGPVDTWSPIARWNANRLPSQKKIPNPSFCCYGADCPVTSALPSFDSCPGYWMGLEGRTDLCQCVEAMEELGYDMSMTDVTGCVLIRRTQLVARFEEAFGEDLSVATARSNLTQVANFGCTGTFHAGGAQAINLPTVDVSFRRFASAGFPLSERNARPQDVYAVLAASNATSVGLVWAISHCTGGNFLIDVRYAATSSWNMQIAVDGVAVSTITVPSTTSLNILMRNNFVSGIVPLVAGDHTVTITKEAGQGQEGPYIHQITVCTSANAASTGCLLGSDSIFCYQTVAGSIVSNALGGAGLVGSADQVFLSKAEAQSICATRSDCDAVQETQESYLGSFSYVYRLRQGSAASAPTDTRVPVVYLKAYC